MNFLFKLHFNSIKDSFPFPVLVVDANNRLLSFNKFADGLADLWKNDELQDVKKLTPKFFDKVIKDSYANVTLKGENIYYRVQALAMDDREDILLCFLNITEDVLFRQTLIESRQRYKDLVDVSSQFAWETNPYGEFTFVSARGLLDWSRSDLLEKNTSEFLVNSDEINPFTSQEPCQKVEVWFKQQIGSDAFVLVDSLPMYSKEGKWIGCRGICHDITFNRIKSMELENLRKRERLLTKITRTIYDYLVPIDMLSFALTTLKEFTGATGGLLLGMDEGGHYVEIGEDSLPKANQFIRKLKDFTDFGCPIDHQEQSVIVIPTNHAKQKNGYLILWHKSDLDFHWDNQDLIVLHELTEHIGLILAQMFYQKHLEKISRTDELTGLLNRRAFLEELDVRVSHAKRKDREGALIYIDLDNFKQINDTKGHNIGDDLLKEFSAFMQKNSRASDIVARLGGDEFAVWLEEEDSKGATKKIQNLYQKAEKVFRKYDSDLDKKLGMSIGITVFEPKVDFNLEMLIGRADEAMYHIKHNGKGGIHEAQIPKEETKQA